MSTIFDWIQILNWFYPLGSVRSGTIWAIVPFLEYVRTIRNEMKSNQIKLPNIKLIGIFEHWMLFDCFGHNMSSGEKSKDMTDLMCLCACYQLKRIAEKMSSPIVSCQSLIKTVIYSLWKSRRKKCNIACKKTTERIKSNEYLWKTRHTAHKNKVKHFLNIFGYVFFFSFFFLGRVKRGSSVNTIRYHHRPWIMVE